MPTSDNAIAMLMDRFGKNLVISSGPSCGSLWFLQLSATDGTISYSSGHANLHCFDRDGSSVLALASHRGPVEQSKATIFVGTVRARFNGELSPCLCS